MVSFYTSRFCSAGQWTEVAVAAIPTPSTTSGSAHHSSEQDATHGAVDIGKLPALLPLLNHLILFTTAVN